jgi:hypothetical protein
MASDERNLLTILNSELAFLEMGGYRETARATWRPQFIFQDSPTCLNFDPQHTPRPCSECAIVQFVPEALRTRRVPCRFVTIGEEGRTIEWYYRNGTPEELEAALAGWLKRTIAGLEEERAETLNANQVPEVHVEAHFVKVAA